jgi:HlyD family secretion protein
MTRFIKTTILVLGFAGLILAGLAFFSRSKTEADPYQLSPVKQGDLAVTVSATGTIEPEEVIDVGAQVAGRIMTFGKDKGGKPVDYGSQVEEGTVLANIDPALYVSDVDQANASMVQAKANLARAEADLGQLKAKLEQAQNDWNRAQELGPSDALSRSSYDAYKSAFETAKANVAVGEATIAQNRGAVLQAEAAVSRAQRNLGYCTIVSPVNGVIIDRRVNIGQTVVSSLNAPSLFLIAKDLRHMQVWVAVNEADIGSIHTGQPVTFTVDARPGKVFAGKVGKVRLNASMTQNVVNYTVEVLTDNSQKILLPYLTANVRFQVARKDNVLTVPNAALKWKPRPEQIDPKFAADAIGAGPRSGSRSGGRRAQDLPRADSESRSGTLWAVAENGLRPIPVSVGLSDGVKTEIEGTGLADGLEVVTGENSLGQRPQTGGTPTNPFTPQFRGRQGGGRGAH